MSGEIESRPVCDVDCDDKLPTRVEERDPASAINPKRSCAMVESGGAVLRREGCRRVKAERGGTSEVANGMIST